MPSSKIKSFKTNLSQLKDNLTHAEIDTLFQFILQVAQKDDETAKIFAHACCVEVLIFLYFGASKSDWLDQFAEEKPDHQYTRLYRSLNSLIDTPLPKDKTTIQLLHHFLNQVTTHATSFSLQTHQGNLITSYQAIQKNMLTCPSKSCANSVTVFGFLMGVASIGTLFFSLHIVSSGLFIAGLCCLGVALAVTSYGLLERYTLFREKVEIGGQKYFTTTPSVQ